MAEAQNQDWFAFKQLQKKYRDSLILMRDGDHQKEFSIIFTDLHENECIVDITLGARNEVPTAFSISNDIPIKMPQFKKTLNVFHLCREIQAVLAGKGASKDAIIVSGSGKAKRAGASSPYHEAAKLIMEAEVILISTGAGWSADSGLATYPGIAEIRPYQKRNLTYYDICQPWWLKKEPETFYGFWGDSCNVYRETTPHAGYALLKSWKDNILMKKNRINAKLGECISAYNYKDNYVTADPFFSLTSNVDAHWWNKNVGAVFEREEVTEVHGNIEYWQTSPFYKNVDADDNVWRLDPEFRFEVDKKTMLANDKSKWPTDPKSGTYARPCILMFNDWNWNNPHDKRFSRWNQSIQKVQSEFENVKVVCLEIGCGMRVPTIRNMSQQFIKRTGGTLIRINPDKSALETYYGEVDSVMIKSTGLAALQKIDKIMKSMRAEK